MTHIDSILELLDAIAPGAYCDDCLSTELAIQPRQTVNQIGRRLAAGGQTTRETGTCISCSKQKVVNSLVAKGPATRGKASTVVNEGREQKEPQLNAPVTTDFDVEHARTDVVRICSEIWRKHKQGPAPHSISVLINSLRADEFLPTHQANMMLTLCGLRNVYVYENVKIGPRETEIARRAASIIEEWWAMQQN